MSSNKKLVLVGKEEPDIWVLSTFHILSIFYQNLILFLSGFYLPFATMCYMNDIYDDWNILKKNLSKKTRKVYCNKREIWWCSIGMNIGTELYGKNDLFERPVLILKVYNKETILVVPLTSKVKEGIYYSAVALGNVISRAVLSQSRTINTKRLSRKVGRISKQNFSDVLKNYLKSI